MDDYLYIRAWGYILGSDRYYIDDEIKKAREDNAPQDAIYVKHNFDSSAPREWIRYESVTSWHTHSRMEAYFESKGWAYTTPTALVGRGQ